MDKSYNSFRCPRNKLQGQKTSYLTRVEPLENIFFFIANLKAGR
jgi:hypothetical protein